ncbi:spaetzle-processing enzyme [Drosophila teissieri]|uniref:spaetzle-processing enzyme n=1 Tax=Drosophila teissieri TaxID=7243 RepID=UPI001CBA59AA|nr:spaetzle-processing enzyme [Drosophila teissieri]
MTYSQRAQLRNKQCGLDNNAKEQVHRVLVCCPIIRSWDLPDKSVCGQGPSTPYIVGGSVAQQNEFPWISLLLYKSNLPSLRDSPICAGSLITNRYVLTAAHCLDVINFTVTEVRLGEHNLSTSPDCIVLPSNKEQCAPAHLDIKVSLSIKHEQYYTIHGRYYYNDIALLRLESSVAFSSTVKPICIRPDFELAYSSFEKRSLKIAGWGSYGGPHHSTVLRSGTIIGMNTKNCSSRFPSLGTPDEDIHICAMGQDGTDTGRGDSGGPLMFSEGRDVDQFYYLAGITSYGGGPPYGSGPAIYTKTSSFFRWITDKMYETENHYFDF